MPSRPETARKSGFDTIDWARRGLIDMLIPSDFFITMDTDMPIELWKDLLRGLPVTLAAGFTHNVAPYPEAGVDGKLADCPEIVRGAAAAALHRGADRVYLFNYCYLEHDLLFDKTKTDSVNRQPILETLLNEIGSLETLAGKPRRHIVTYVDHLAPGQPQQSILPATCDQDQRTYIEINIGPAPDSMKTKIILGLKDQSDATFEVRLNGELCELISDHQPPQPMHPIVKQSLVFAVPKSAAHAGRNIIEILPNKKTTIAWAELSIVSSIAQISIDSGKDFQQ